MLRVSHFPAGHVVVAALGLAAIIWAWLPEAAPRERAGLAIAGAIASFVGLRDAMRRRGTLQIDDTIQYTRGRRGLSVPREAAQAVVVHRPLLGLVKPTVYVLQVRETEPLLFAEHWFSGRRAMGRAARVTEALGVPVYDPRGAWLRASRFAPARWIGRGEEWRLLPVVVPICALAAWWASA